MGIVNMFMFMLKDTYFEWGYNFEGSCKCVIN